MTGAWNRRYLEATLDAETRRGERYGHPFSVLVIDVDQYKPINDAHGHDVGDRVLAALVARIAGSIRANVDVLARFGGDEFVLVLPETDLANARIVAAKVADIIRAEPFDAGTARVHVTVSGGLAVYPESGASPQALLAAADRALYRAKERGRDRVEEASGTGEGAPAA